MGRHADSTRKRGIRVPIAAIAIVLVVLCAVALGIWWWTLKSATDPIDADPVDAYGVVLTSPSCTAGGLTTVRVSGTSPPVTATLNACGYRVGEQLPVQYLAGHPEVVRLTGTATAGATSMAARLLPIGILAAGLIAVLATISLLVERRRSRHQVAPAGRRAPPGAADPAAPASHAASVDAAVVPVTAVGDAPPAAGTQPPAPGGQAGSTPVEPSARADPPDAGVFPESTYGTGYLAAGRGRGGTGDVPGAAVLAPGSGAGISATAGGVRALENAVVIDEGMLFTHTHPEPPEPAGAPVELSGNDDTQPM